MKIAIYSRKSLFTGKGESIENQIEMCKKYICFQFPEAEKKDIFVYEDEGYSAKDLNRPQFQRMMADLDALQFDYIVCYRLDRFSRNVSDFSSLIDALEKRGVGLICIKEHFDTSTPMGRAMMYITSVFAQLERETLAERVRDNMHMLARTGRYLGGPPPTGYVSEAVAEVIIDGKIKTSYVLKINEEEINIVQLMFEAYLATGSVSAVCRCLTQSNIRSKATGKSFSNLGVRDIIKNPVYCIADGDAYDYFCGKGADICNGREEWNGAFGIAAYNKRDHSNGGSKRNEISKWIIAVGRHQGIISGREWIKVQNTLSGNRSQSRAVHTECGLLSGLLCCALCGKRMYAKKYNTPSEKFSYICSSKLSGTKARCCSKNLLGEETDAAVLQTLQNRLNKQVNISSLSPFEQRHLLLLLVKKIEWNGEELNIFLYDIN